MFITQGPVNPESSLFVGRTDELSQIDRWLKQVTCVGVVVGARQTGKTSLLYRACHIFQEKYAFVFINLQDIEGVSIDECYSFIAEEIQDQLDIQAVEPSAPLPSTGLKFQRFLRQATNHTKAVRVGIILDEIGALPVPVAINLAHTIRSIFTNRIQKREFERYVFILSGATDMLKLTGGKSSPLWNVTESIYLSDLALPDVRNLLQEGFRQTDIQSSPDIHQTVFEWTHGHSYWVQLLGASLLKEYPDPLEATLERILEHLLRTEDRNIPHTLRTLNQDDGRQMEVVRSILEGQVVPFTRSDETLARLEINGLIRDHNGQCAIRNRIYTEALKTRFNNTNGDSYPGSPVPMPQIQSQEPIQVTLWFYPTKQGAKIVWDSDVSGTAESSFKLPYAKHQLPTIIRSLDAIQRIGEPLEEFDEQSRNILREAGLWDEHHIRRDAYKIVGNRLFAALTRSTKGREALKVVRETARNQGRAVNYILRFPENAVELAALPWEMLWDERQSVLLSRGNRDIDSCERYLMINEALSPPIAQGQKLRVLVLSPKAGNPIEASNDNAFAHSRIQSTLADNREVEYHELSPVTMTTLNDYMRQPGQFVPDVIHYQGAGMYRDGTGYLLFDDAETTQQGEWVSATRLSAQFGNIRLLVIQASQSSKVEVDETEDRGLLTGVAPALSAVSEAVVAMQLRVQENALTRFTEVFYEDLINGRSLQAAVAEARRSLFVICGEQTSWYVPTLYIRTRKKGPVYLVQPSNSATI